VGQPSKEERELLLAMYGQMWNNINRHVMVIWQSVTAIVGSLALFSLVEKGVIGLDMGTTFVVIIGAWLLAHTYDSSAWFNRNQSIISAIEKELLSAELAERLHPVIGKRRSISDMVLQFRIQQWLALAILLLVLGHHFVSRVLPGFGSPFTTFEAARAIPYVASTAAVVGLVLVRRKAYGVKDPDKSSP